MGREGHRFVIEFNDAGIVTDYGELGEWVVRYHARKISNTLHLQYPLRIPLGGLSPSSYLTVYEDHFLWEKRPFREITQLHIFSEEPNLDILNIILIMNFGSPNLERMYLSLEQRKRFEEKGIKSSLTVIWLPVLLEYIAQVSPDVAITVVDRRWYHERPDEDEQRKP